MREAGSEFHTSTIRKE